MVNWPQVKNIAFYFNFITNKPFNRNQYCYLEVIAKMKNTLVKKPQDNHSKPDSRNRNCISAETCIRRPFRFNKILPKKFFVALRLKPTEEKKIDSETERARSPAEWLNIRALNPAGGPQMVSLTWKFLYYGLSLTHAGLMADPHPFREGVVLWFVASNYKTFWLRLGVPSEFETEIFEHSWNCFILASLQPLSHTCTPTHTHTHTHTLSLSFTSTPTHTNSHSSTHSVTFPQIRFYTLPHA